MRSFNPDENEVALVDDVDALNRHERRLFLDAVVGERPEVVAAQETGGSPAHFVEINLVPDPPDEVLGEGGAASGDLVQIAARLRVVAGVESVTGQFDVEYVDVARQRVVEAHPQHARRQRRDDVEMRDLGERMDAGVGPAGAVDLKLFLTGHMANGLRELSLHRARILLDLPSAVTSPGILENDFEAGHVDADA